MVLGEALTILGVFVILGFMMWSRLYKKNPEGMQRVSDWFNSEQKTKIAPFNNFQQIYEQNRGTF